MNLTQPPFDDVHVRRAMNWIMDKAELRRAWGGPLLGSIAHHVVPDTMFEDELAEYDPYRTPGDHGSLAKAKQAMRGSRYDTAHDGTCSAPACHDVLLLDSTRTTAFLKLLPLVEAGAKKLGITFHVVTDAAAYSTLGTTSKNIPIAVFTAWTKDYPDAVTFLSPLFDSDSIIPSGNANTSLVGLRPAQAKKLGVTGSTANIPSVYPDLARCGALAGQRRRACYERLDKKLMTGIVPWVPYLQANVAHITGPRVTQWQFDQFTVCTAYAHVAVA
jgi:peptide/nickel transport system substrate-binding protein